MQTEHSSKKKRPGPREWRICLLPVFCFLLLCLSRFDFHGGAAFAQPENPPIKLEYSEERPANFVFLIDVSGSMVTPRTMVKAADGSTVTLFEALRSALKQIAADSRIISAGSKVAFITFGTRVTEKSDWPVNLKDPSERQSLLSKIASPEELQADKHGDTYMAGALEEAYKKALKFSEESAPCTTTFILMFTDGWDEPPAGAEFQIRPVAEKIVAKGRELKDKLGVNTWQVRVIGLQRLPDKKAGTTTAAEVAQLLDGQFLDVTKSQGGTVAERIYLSLKRTIEELKGQIELPPPDSAAGILNFGQIKDNPRARATVTVTNRSCYVEKITGVREVSAATAAADLSSFKQTISSALKSGRLPGIDGEHEIRAATSLPSGAIHVGLQGASEFLLAPVNRQEPGLVDSSSAFNKVALQLQIGPSCRPGTYFGVLTFDSTAKVPGKIPYVVNVPSRYFVDPDPVVAEVQKKGFFLNQPADTELSFTVGARVLSSYATDFDFDIEPGPAHKLKKSGSSDARLNAQLLNNGRSISLQVSSGNDAKRVTVPVHIPADTEPGIYEGELKIHSKASSTVAGPAKVKYKLTVLPSPWDQMGPLVVVTFGILALVIAVGVVMAMVGSRDRL